MYFLKLALRPWRKAPVGQLFSGFAVGFLLVLVGFLFWLQEGLRPVLARLQGEQVITAYLAPQVSDEQARAMGDQIRMGLSAPLRDEAEIEWVGIPEFLAKLKKTYPDLGGELEELGSENQALIPRHYTVSGMLPDTALAQVRAVPGVESAESSRDRYRHIVGAFRMLRWIARFLVAGLCFALLTGLIHLAKTNAFLHRDSVAILRQWGASRLQTRLPGILSGIWVGLLGGTLAAGLWIGFSSPLSQGIRTFSPVLRQLAQPQAQWALGLFALGLFLGLLSGLFGQWAGERST